MAETLTPSVALFNELIASSKNLPHAASHLGSIQLDLSEIGKRANSLRDKHSEGNDTKAHYLLAGSGINAEDIYLQLSTLALNPGIEYYDKNVAGIDSYLQNKKQDSILAAIADSVRLSASDFDQFLNQNVSLDWAKRKEQICQHFGLIQKDDNKNRDASNNINNINNNNTNNTNNKLTKTVLGGTWGAASLGKLILGTPEIGTATPRQRQFAKAISALNNARSKGQAFPVSTALSTAADNLSDAKSQQLNDAWDILSYISGESVEDPAKEGVYRKMYAAAPGSPDGLKVRKQISHGSKMYLEHQFFACVEAEIAKSPQDALLGGVPSVYNKIKAYLNVRYLRGGQWTKENMEILNGVPVWAVLYYMVRSGHLQEALDFTLEIESSLEKIERSFPVYLQAYVKSRDHVLSRDMHDRILTEFNQHIRFLDAHSDPFKFALYKIIGRCDLSRKVFPEVLETAEDWLWAHLVVSRETVDGPLQDRYTLLDVQRTVLNFGSKHFNPSGKSPGLYFQMLLLCGLFEAAVSYALTFCPVDAVHYAIALAYYGLLRVSKPEDTEDSDGSYLSVDKKDQQVLHFARLIGHYTRDFRRSDAVDAVDYLVLLCFYRDQEDACHEALRELVLETRQFSVLLGDIRADGARSPGCIERRSKLIGLDKDDFLTQITAQAALRAEDDGRFADAILLYQLSEQYDTVVSIMNRTLGDALSMMDFGDSNVEPAKSLSLLSTATNPAQLAATMRELYTNNPQMYSHVSQRNRDTCEILLQIVSARESYSRGHWAHCIAVIDNINVIPIHVTADVGTIRRRAQDFVSLHESTARNVPSLLLMTMTCCAELAQNIQESEFNDATRCDRLAELKARSRNCMIYAGMIQYRMPREVYSQLTALDTNLNSVNM